MDKDTSYIWNFRYGLEKEKATGNVEYLATEYGGVWITDLIFMTDLTLLDLEWKWFVIVTLHS